MSLPRLWPRTVCVYCGARITPDPINGARHPFACWRHASLVTLDPHYTEAP